MKKLICLGALSALLLASCGEEKNVTKPDAAEEKEEKVEVEDQTVEEKELVAYATNITGGTFVKSISLIDNYSIIQFYNDYNEYKKSNPDSLLTEDDYQGYFDTEETIEKILVVENVRLLRQFPNLTGAKMTLPFKGKVYSIEMDREAVNDYLGFNVEELKTEDDSWTTKFVNPIGYDEAKRKDFMSKFAKVN